MADNEEKQYYEWKSIYPQLQVLIDNIDVIRKEAASIPQWVPWPEELVDDTEKTVVRDWTVFPLLHTFPANDESKMSWVDSTCSYCPETTRILKGIEGLRTALFSKLGPETVLTPHTGWKELSNFVLRCHLNLKIPADGRCGMIIENVERHHIQGDILCFDDSKCHLAFNRSKLKEDRVVLIVDVMRPLGVLPGTAKGSMTNELTDFMSLFR